jgi:hypothetical protein
MNYNVMSCIADVLGNLPLYSPLTRLQTISAYCHCGPHRPWHWPPPCLCPFSPLSLRSPIPAISANILIPILYDHPHPRRLLDMLPTQASPPGSPALSLC